MQEISKIFGFGDATTLALDEVDLQVERGEFVAIMGPSGSGKSTLLHIIGLLDRPTHGNFWLDNRPVAKLRPIQRAKVRRDKIGFVFQSFNLLPRLSVLENVALPLAYKGVTHVKRLKRASDILELVGLREREYYMPKQLSGGQLQRAAIARALVNNPSIIIADEPTGNLDSNSSRVVMELLSELHRQGNTILMVTHNAELTRYASRVIYMHDGSIVQDESSRIGEVAKGASQQNLHQHQSDEDAVVAGVSALMRDIPGKELEVRKPNKNMKPAKTKKRSKKTSGKRSKKS